jgi:hypothetical protein
MTIHQNEDRLLELALGLLDEESQRQVRLHLQHCATCRELYDDVEGTLLHLKNVPLVTEPRIPELPGLPHRRYALIRTAAVLAIGFGLGVVAAESLETPPIVTIQQQISPRSPELPRSGFVPCDRVDIAPSSH